MAKNKPLLAALKRAGMQIDGQDVEMETEDAPALTEQASTKLAGLQAAHDSLLAIDPDSPCLVGIKKDIETVKRQTGHTAQSKTVKDLTALDYQLNLHHDTVVREQQKTLEAHQTTLQSLKKAVSDHEAVMEKQRLLDQDVLANIRTLKEQTAAQIKQFGPEPAAPPPTHQVMAPTITPPQVTDMTTALQSILDQVATITLPEGSEAQQQTLQQVQATLASTLQPLLGTDPKPASTYGKAPAVAAFGSTRNDPYGASQQEPPPAATVPEMVEVPP